MTRPVRKFPSSPELELPRPKLVPLRLDQIIPYTTDPEFEWVRNLHHLPMSSPTLEPEAISLLALCQPLVVSRNPQGGPKTAEPIVKPTLPSANLAAHLCGLSRTVGVDSSTSVAKSQLKTDRDQD